MSLCRGDSEAAIIHARDLVKIYETRGERVQALRGVNVTLEAGAFAVVHGPSGSGKSTLLHLLGGIDRPTSGEVCVAGLSLHRASASELLRFRREHVGFVFQSYNLLPSLSARDNVALPLLARGADRAMARAEAGEALQAVGLADRGHHRPAQLSGGEQQRVAIARAIVGAPALVLADEPTGNLDAETSRAIVQLMADLNRELEVTFLIATHDEEVASQASDVYELRGGRLDVAESS